LTRLAGARRSFRLRTTDGAEPITQHLSTGEYPHLAEMATEYYLQPGYDFSNEFELGLNVILEALTMSIPIKRSRSAN
jgi:hypothetical protein